MFRDRRVKILYLVNNPDFLASHRLNLVKLSLAEGCQVHIVGPMSASVSLFLDLGCHYHLWDLSRKSTNPFRELFALRELIKIYRRIRPDLTHHLSLKPVVYGGIAARVVGIQASVSAITGLGASFIARSLKSKFLRLVIERGFKMVAKHKNNVFIFQNADDQTFFVKKKIARLSSAHVIPGGVCLQQFQPLPLPSQGPWTVVLASRLLRDKGVLEFVEAARQLRANKAIRCVLVGDVDEQNPASLSQREIATWVQQGIVEHWGFQKDIQSIFAACHIVCLPSYREGSPRVLIEALACGRPIITTDVPGCRDLVIDGVNGLIVPARDADGLAEGIRKMVADPLQLALMGQKSRKLALAHYSEHTVLERTLAVYQQLLMVGP